MTIGLEKSQERKECSSNSSSCCSDDYGGAGGCTPRNIGNDHETPPKTRNDGYHQGRHFEDDEQGEYDALFVLDKAANGDEEEGCDLGDLGDRMSVGRDAGGQQGGGGSLRRRAVMSVAAPAIISGGGVGEAPTAVPNGKECDGEEEECTETLPQDVYSILILVPRRSTAWEPKSRRECCSDGWSVFFVVLLWTFQISIFAIVANELFAYLRVSEGGERPPPFNMPVNVSRDTRMAQIFAIVIAVASADDVISSTSMGFNASLRIKVPVHSCWFALSCFLKWTAGMMGLFISWVLVVQSSSAVQLFAEFAGMAFVNELDDILFRLAYGGFFGANLQHKTRKVTEFRIPEGQTLSWGRIVPRVMTVLVLVGMICPWAYYALRQGSGEYFTPRLVIRIGNEVNELDEFHGGLFRLISTSNRGDQHPIYEEVNDPQAYIDLDDSDLRDDLTDGLKTTLTWQRGRFGYCVQRQMWTYFYHDGSLPCEGVAFRSRPTGDYDITSVSPSDWYVEAVKAGGDLSMSSTVASQISVPGFALGKAMCYDDNECNFGKEENVTWVPMVSEDGTTKYRGQVDESAPIMLGGSCNPISGTCQCYPGFVGIRCEFKLCKTLMNMKDTGIKGVATPSNMGLVYLPSTFSVLFSDETMVLKYSRPVYVYRDEDGNITWVMLYTGRRWFLTNAISRFSQDTIIQFLSKFHGVWTTSRLFDFFLGSSSYISEANDAGDPRGLKWSHFLGPQAKSEHELTDGRPLFGLDETKVLFACADCADDRSFCGHRGVCSNTTEICECHSGFSGWKCNNAPFRGTYTIYIPEAKTLLGLEFPSQVQVPKDSGLSCAFCEFEVDGMPEIALLSTATGGPQEYNTSQVWFDMDESHLWIVHSIGPSDTSGVFWGRKSFKRKLDMLEAEGANSTIVRSFLRNEPGDGPSDATVVVEVNGLDVNTNLDVDRVCENRHPLPPDKCLKQCYVNQTRAILHAVFQFSAKDEDKPYTPDDVLGMRGAVAADEENPGRHRDHVKYTRSLMREFPPGLPI